MNSFPVRRISEARPWRVFVFLGLKKIPSNRPGKSERDSCHGAGTGEIDQQEVKSRPPGISGGVWRKYSRTGFGALHRCEYWPSQIKNGLRVSETVLDFRDI